MAGTLALLAFVATGAARAEPLFQRSDGRGFHYDARIEDCRLSVNRAHDFECQGPSQSKVVTYDVDLSTVGRIERKVFRDLDMIQLWPWDFVTPMPPDRPYDAEHMITTCDGTPYEQLEGGVMTLVLPLDLLADEEARRLDAAWRACTPRWRRLLWSWRP